MRGVTSHCSIPLAKNSQLTKKWHSVDTEPTMINDHAHKANDESALKS
jgi:hypothetical protein